ncbi:hypothetical protein [Luteibacter sp. E-22]|uniref:hypothetical protein n=1 Tax=Luteibacter sp. E-22 TaxID=3404050 RepID=UPI003CE8FA39
MISVRHIAAGCALALFATSATAGNGPLGSALTIKGGVSTTSVENFEAVPSGAMPAAGLDLASITVRYAGGVTSGVQNGLAPNDCPQLVADGYALGPVEKAEPYDIVIDFKEAPTDLGIGLCGSPFPPLKDTTVEIFAADGSSLQSTTFSAGRIFAERVTYTGSTPAGYAVIHAGGHVYVDNIISGAPVKH